MVMDDISSAYTAFSAVDGHFEYIVMPQGAKNAANHFARMIEKLLVTFDTVFQKHIE
jgi:hypothetical protein